MNVSTWVPSAATTDPSPQALIRSSSVKASTSVGDGLVELLDGGFQAGGHREFVCCDAAGCAGRPAPGPSSCGRRTW